MTDKEAREIRAVVLAALFEYEELKKTHRIRAVKKAITGTLAATAISGVSCMQMPSKESLITQRLHDYKTQQKNTSNGVRADIANQVIPKKLLNQTQTINGVVHFGLNHAGIALAHKDRLDAFIQQLPKNAELTIIGLTDASGNADYNIELGRKRARSVAKYLANKGVTVKAFGSQTIEDHSPGWMSRRVDIVVNYVATDAEPLAIFLPPLAKHPTRQISRHHQPIFKHLAANTFKTLLNNTAVKTNQLAANRVTTILQPQAEYPSQAEHSFDAQAKVGDNLLDAIR